MLDIVVTVPDVSSQLISTLENHRDQIPFANEALEVLVPLRHMLLRQQEIGSQAMEGWRIAIAQRWQAEVVAQRLYDQVRRQLSDQAQINPQLQSLIGPQRALAPEELLEELRRLYSVRCLCLPSAARLATEVCAACDTLSQAINEVRQHEATRRKAHLEYRITEAAFLRAGYDVSRRLAEQYASLVPQNQNLLA